MTNEQKFLAELQKAYTHLTRDREDVGYYAEDFQGLYCEKGEDNIWRLNPTNDAEKLVEILEQNRSRRWYGDYKEGVCDLHTLLPFDLDIAYQLQEKTLCPVFWELDCHVEDTNLILSADVSVTRESKSQTISANISYAGWASYNNVPVCESDDDLWEFCEKTLDTEEKKRAFIELNVENPTGDLSEDYSHAIMNVYNAHFHDGCLRSMDLWWDTFLKDVANTLADNLIKAAKEEGFAITRGDLIELGINDVLKGEYVTEEPKEPAKRKAKTDVER